MFRGNRQSERSSSDCHQDKILAQLFVTWTSGSKKRSNIGCRPAKRLKTVFLSGSGFDDPIYIKFWDLFFHFEAMRLIQSAGERRWRGSTPAGKSRWLTRRCRRRLRATKTTRRSSLDESRDLLVASHADCKQGQVWRARGGVIERLIGVLWLPHERASWCLSETCVVGGNMPGATLLREPCGALMSVFTPCYDYCKVFLTAAVAFSRGCLFGRSYWTTFTWTLVVKTNPTPLSFRL